MDTVPTAVAQEQVFRDALHRLETCLATPLVSGELVDWARNSDEAIRNFMIRWLERRDVSHHRSLLQIGEDDPELLARVEQLQKENDDITDKLRRLAERLARLAAQSEPVEPNEVKLSDEANKLTEDGLILLANVRRQEVAIQTWLTESSHRDRGVGD